MQCCRYTPQTWMHALQPPTAARHAARASQPMQPQLTPPQQPQHLHTTHHEGEHRGLVCHRARRRRALFRRHRTVVQQGQRGAQGGDAVGAVVGQVGNGVALLRCQTVRRRAIALLSRGCTCQPNPSSYTLPTLAMPSHTAAASAQARITHKAGSLQSDAGGGDGAQRIQVSNVVVRR